MAFHFLSFGRRRCKNTCLGEFLELKRLLMQTTSLTDLILLSTDKSLLPRVKHTLWVLITHAFPGVERKQVKSITKTLINK